MITPHTTDLNENVRLAQQGDRHALEQVVRAIQPILYRLALRFSWHPADAEDATQEILIRIITGLSGFRGDSSFHTWSYRTACNALLNLKQQRMELHTLSIEQFGEDIDQGLRSAPDFTESSPDEPLLLEEIKIGCTLAMLLCLDRAHRIAYILGDILEIEHQEAARVLEIEPAAYRKRLSRARADITSLMMAKCGLVAPSNACRCRKRVDSAITLGRINPQELLFATSREQAQAFPQVVTIIRKLEASQRAAALYQSHSLPAPSSNFTEWLRALVDEAANPPLHR